jgi:hypothetical protein
MIDNRRRLISREVCLLSPIISLLLVNVGMPLQRPTAPAVKNPRGEDRQREVREKGLRSVELLDTIDKTQQRRVETAVEQARQDFKRLQIIRNEMVRNLTGHSPMDYRVISEETAEINKRANRLRLSLMPTVSEEAESEKEQANLTDRELKAALVRLCNLIASFIDNPTFKAPDNPNVEQSTKAGSDLKSIIELSGSVRRSVEKLAKTTR